MKTVLCLLLAATGWAQSPRLLATPGDLARAQALAATAPWAKAVIDQTIANALAWPKSHLTKYGLSDLALPPEGGQWTLWEVCPVHGVSLKYTAPTTHKCPIDGRTWSGWPFDQVVYDWRHTDLANNARDLALAWQWTGEAKYADAAAWILKQYGARYLTYPLHDKDNKTSTSGARAHAQTLDEAVWLIPMAWAYDLLAGSPALSPADRAQIESGLLRAAVQTIQRNDAGASNWQSWHNAAIGSVGFALGDNALIRAAIDGKSGFHFQMANSVTPDGFWYEGAWSYHFYALDPHVRLAEMAARAGLDLFAESPLRRMFSGPLQIAFPNGQLPAFNDSGAVSLYSYDSLFEAAWAQYQDPAFAAVLGTRARGLNALLWGAPDFPQVAFTGLRSQAFAASGYAVLRSPVNDHTVIMKFGPHGGGHGHYDKLNMVSFSEGVIQALDPGTQSYAAPTHATWDKETVAHNTVTVDETTQAEATGTLLWADLDHDVYRAASASAGNAYKQATLTRTMLLTPEYTLDLFTAKATDGKPHRFDWTYHNEGTLTLSLAAAPYSAFPKQYGYQHLTPANAATADGEWQATFDRNPVEALAYGSVYNSTANVQGTYQISPEQPASGRYSGKATYHFAGDGYILFSTPQLTGIPQGAPTGLTLKLYGDSSGHNLALRINDSTDERFVVSIGPINWTGWKQITVYNPESWSHYLGNADGVFDGPAKTVTLELTRLPGAPIDGVLYVDDIQLLYGDEARTVADFEIPQRNVRVWMLGAPGTTVVTGNGLGPDLTRPVPFVMARRTGTAAVFVSILEPYQDAPMITAVQMGPNGELIISSPGYTDTIVVNADGVAFTRN